MSNPIKGLCPWTNEEAFDALIVRLEDYGNDPGASSVSLLLMADLADLLADALAALPDDES